jgi:hypothetical protein
MLKISDLREECYVENHQIGEIYVKTDGEYYMLVQFMSDDIRFVQLSNGKATIKRFDNLAEVDLFSTKDVLVYGDLKIYDWEYEENVSFRKRL